MRILYLDCGMGAAGDMLQGALVSLLSKEDQGSFLTEMNKIGLEDVDISLTDDIKCGISCTHVNVKVGSVEEESLDVCENSQIDHDHHHEGHTHNHNHSHSTLHDIEHIVNNLNVSDRVKSDVIEIYKIIAAAESKVHGKDVSMVHFHEVGMKDAIADIAGVAILVEKIGADRIICSPVNTGFGKVRCAHGILPVPAPATAEILKKIPVYSGKIEGEMCTPTGAAILKYYVDDFSYAPIMTYEKIGYGSGKKDFEAANVLKAVLGDLVCGDSESYSNSDSENELKDNIIELRCNIDDMTGEDLAYATDKIMEGGAKDVFVSSVLMKKGRMGYLLTVLTDKNRKEEIAGLIFKHTSTIGIREYSVERMLLNRESIINQTDYGDISVKVANGYGIRKEKPEFEDLKNIADKSGISITKLRDIVK